LALPLINLGHLKWEIIKHISHVFQIPGLEEYRFDWTPPSRNEIGITEFATRTEGQISSSNGVSFGAVLYKTISPSRWTKNEASILNHLQWLNKAVLPTLEPDYDVTASPTRLYIVPFL